MKMLSGFLALAITMASLSYSKPSHAAVGMITLNPVMALTGLAMSGAGAGVIIADPFEYETNGEALGKLAAGFFFVVGLVVLDGENSQEVQFKAISPKDLVTLQITEKERLSYNSELDQVNFIFSEVQSEIAKANKPKLQDVKAIWDSYQNLVSEETFKAMVQVSRSAKK